MLGRGLRSVLLHMSQADDNADVVLLDSYTELIFETSTSGSNYPSVP